MGLVLCNGHGTSIWTSIMFYSPRACGPETDGFEMMGWWKIDPRSCTLVYANDLADVNRYWYYFAEARDGYVWAGPWAAQVTNRAFGGAGWCHGLGRSDANVRIGYRELDVGRYDHITLTLVG